MRAKGQETAFQDSSQHLRIARWPAGSAAARRGTRGERAPQLLGLSTTPFHKGGTSRKPPRGVRARSAAGPGVRGPAGAVVASQGAGEQRGPPRHSGICELRLGAGRSRAPGCHSKGHRETGQPVLRAGGGRGPAACSRQGQWPGGRGKRGPRRGGPAGRCGGQVRWGQWRPGRGVAGTDRVGDHQLAGQTVRLWGNRGRAGFGRGRDAPAPA